MEKKIAAFAIAVWLTTAPQEASALSKKRAPTDSVHQTAAAPLKAKYGRFAKPLSRSHEFFKLNPAPDFWALMPYYATQQSDSSCSSAAATTVLNAIRKDMNLLSTDELITEVSLLNKPELSAWKQAVSPKGGGATLDQLKSWFSAALKAFGVEHFELELFHVSDTSPKALRELVAALIKNEKSDSDFMIVNFLQSTLTGDADVGHMAAVGAYDATRKRVLILDPDRKWYEPYWVPEKLLLESMATHDPVSGFARGFLRVHVYKKH